MATEQQFRQYIVVKRQQWASRVPALDSEYLLANYYLLEASKNSIVTDLRNDGQFFTDEICALVNNSRDEDVLRVLSELLGEAAGVPYAGAAAEVLLAAIKEACKKGAPPWLVLPLATIAAGGALVLADHLIRKRRRG